MYNFSLDEMIFYPDNPLVLMAGPCVIESRDHCLFMAEKLKKLAHDTRSVYIQVFFFKGQPQFY